jgi:hypothetical protein
VNIQMSIVINRPAEDVFAYLASEEHIAVLGQQVEYEQEAGEGSPEESRPQGESEMKDGGEVAGEGKMQDEGKPRPYIYIPIMINTLNAPLQEMRQVSEGETGRGTTFVQVYTWRDRTFEIRVVISVYEPARMLAFSISGQPFRPRNKEDQAPPYQPGLALTREPMWLSYVLIPLANGTRLTCTIGIANPEGIFYRLAEPLAAQGWGKIMKEDLGRLKDLLEGRPVPPRQRPTIPGPFKLDVRASIVVKRPIEAVFAHISEIKPTRITPEMQQERVERVSRRFLGIFPYTEVHRQPAIKEIRQEPEGPIGVGTRFVRVFTSRVTYEQVTEISEYEPPRMIVFKLKMGRPRPQEGATGAAVFEFGSTAGGQQGQQGEVAFLESKTVLEPVAGGTLVTETRYSDVGCNKLIAPFVAQDMRRQLQEGLRGMKKELEGTSTS